MNLRRITARAAVAGVTTALAAGALVGATGTAANAAEAGNTYTCTQAGLGLTFDSTLTVSGDLPVPQYWAGAAVPAGLLSVTATVDSTTAGMLASYGASELRVDDFAFDMEGTSVPVPLDGPVEDGAWNGSGTNEAFTTPDPGTASAIMPSAMTVTAVIGGNDVPLDCVLADGQTAQTLASLELLQQSSATSAKAVSVKKGKAAKLPVTVTSTSLGGPVTSGKVTVKEGKKTLGTGKLNKKGKAVVNLGKKLKVGKHKVTVTYAGIPSVSGSKAKSTVTVKK
ncbi:Ig-like domain repeat protein [Nocardioides mangrovi]|uniref:Ig-like domain repeat protein n=1 Tax=Nocardioides mangrovi TaxID=2874580 RepID=A0ABS7U8R8_9ACTN|nr:Ig-like domain repeat protein [Nocardioides mangrovi]MBZ5737363.1 Ig-like domain repeat protein [Nocardioides mangrovi]